MIGRQRPYGRSITRFFSRGTFSNLFWENFYMRCKFSKTTERPVDLLAVHRLNHALSEIRAARRHEPQRLRLRPDVLEWSAGHARGRNVSGSQTGEGELRKEVARTIMPLGLDGQVKTELEKSIQNTLPIRQNTPSPACHQLPPTATSHQPTRLPHLDPKATQY